MLQVHAFRFVPEDTGERVVIVERAGQDLIAGRCQSIQRVHACWASAALASSMFVGGCLKGLAVQSFLAAVLTRVACDKLRGIRRRGISL